MDASDFLSPTPGAATRMGRTETPCNSFMSAKRKHPLGRVMPTHLGELAVVRQCRLVPGVMGGRLWVSQDPCLDTDPEPLYRTLEGSGTGRGRNSPSGCGMCGGQFPDCRVGRLGAHSSGGPERVGRASWRRFLSRVLEGM